MYEGVSLDVQTTNAKKTEDKEKSFVVWGYAGEIKRCSQYWKV